MKNSKIEWTHHTANLWHGCTKVHEGCDNCYAEVLSHRWGNDVWGNDKPRKEVKSVWKELAKMQKAAKAANEMHRVFVGSMMDIFEKPMEVENSGGQNTGQLREKFFQQISDNIYPNLIFLLLTKRPSNINKYIPESWKAYPPTNVMFGTSPVNQKTSLILIVQLQQVNGKKFLSIEPQLDEIYLQSVFESQDEKPDILIDLHSGIDWIIQGGESGHHKRPFNLEWARSMKKQCELFGIPYFFKQIDKIQEIPEDLQIRQFPAW